MRDVFVVKVFPAEVFVLCHLMAGIPFGGMSLSLLHRNLLDKGPVYCSALLSSAQNKVGRKLSV